MVCEVKNNFPCRLVFEDLHGVHVHFRGWIAVDIEAFPSYSFKLLLIFAGTNSLNITVR